jgi:predicted TIM-barrel fold metal-dependent hydrolase
MAISISRRLLLTSLAASASYAGFGHRLSWAQDSGLVGIDAHCHVFNAHDLPVRGFVQRVVFGDSEDLVILDPSPAASRELVPWVGAVLVELLLTGAAPSAEDELREIDEGQPAFVGPPGAPGEDGVRDLALALRSTLSLSMSRSFSNVPELERRASAVGGAHFVQKLFEEAGVDRRLTFSEAGDELPYEALARDLLNGSGPISRYFQWGRLLNSPRRTIVGELVELFGGPDKVRLFTPALVDFSQWLDDEPRSDIESQVRVMERIQRLQTGPLVHCFIGYDPWREVVDLEAGRAGSALEVVKWAVDDMGFIGVKLYPPMGFLPSGNEGSELGYPERAEGIPQFSRKLDEALDRLYSWAGEQGVPVMAHAANSNGAATGFSERASPRNWRAVLQKYPALRLNLGHFGGFEQSVAGSQEDWETLLGELISDGAAALYADASYLREVLPEVSGAAEIARLKAGWMDFIAAHDPEVERLIFGSDWLMLGQEPRHQDYFDAVDDFVASAGVTGERRRRFFGGNAARYMGLMPGEPARLRLETYYRSHSLDPARLAIFDNA